MSPLADAFIAARALRDPGEPSAGPATPTGLPAGPQLEAALSALAARGRETHRELTLDAARFAAHLGRCGTVMAGNLGSIHAGDLYLACAALGGDQAAIVKLRRIHRPVLAGYLRTIDVSAPFLDEVEQRLWNAALVGTDGAEPKLAGYSGHGALAGWVGIAAQRIALMIRRHEAAEERAVGGAAAAADAEPGGDPELDFIKGSLRGKFRTAISAALAGIEDRERMIYKMHLVDGLTVEAIAKVYGVSHSTVSRWLAKASERVVSEAQRLLRDEMQLSPAEFESVAGLVVSQLDLSVSRLLRSA